MRNDYITTLERWDSLTRKETRLNRMDVTVKNRVRVPTKFNGENRIIELFSTRKILKY